MYKLISIVYYLYFKFRGIGLSKKIILRPLVTLSKGWLGDREGKIVIKDDCELSRGVVVNAYGGIVVLGESVFLGEYVVIYGHGGVEVGANTLIAMHTCIVSSNHTIPGKAILIRSQGDILLPVKIGSDVWIGANVTILGGVTIGDGCVVAAGSVVTRDIPPYAIAMGAPARVTNYRHDPNFIANPSNIQS